MLHGILTMQGMIIVSIIFTFLSQMTESNQNNFERLKQTLNEVRFCTEDYGKYKDNANNRCMDKHSKSQLGKTLNRTITILFWNKYWIDGIMDGLGFQPFQTCLHKNCLSTRDKSLLNNPKYIIDAIVFYGGGKGSVEKQNQKDLTEIKQFKESDALVQQMNQGIKPKLVLFIVVRNEIRFH